MSVKPAATAPAAPESAAALIHALGAPLDPQAEQQQRVGSAQQRALAPAPATAAGALIAQLSAPLEGIGAARTALKEGLERASHKPTAPALLAHRVKGGEETRVELTLKEFALIETVFARSPIAVLLSIEEMFILDIYKQLKEAIDLFKEAGGADSNVLQIFAANYFEYVHGKQGPGVLGQLPPLYAQIFLFDPALFSDKKRYLQDLRESFTFVSRILSDLSKNKAAEALKGNKHLKKASQKKLYAANLEKLTRAEKLIRSALESLLFLISIYTSQRDSSVCVGMPFALLQDSKLKRNKDFKPLMAGANPAECLKETTLFFEFFKIGHEWLAKTNKHFAGTDFSQIASGLALVTQKMSKWSVVSKLRRDLFVAICEYSNTIRYLLFRFDDQVKAQATSGGSRQTSIFPLQLAEIKIIVHFLGKVQTLLDIFVVEKQFPGFIPRDIHFINIMDKFAPFRAAAIRAEKGSPLEKTALGQRISSLISTAIGLVERPQTRDYKGLFYTVLDLVHRDVKGVRSHLSYVNFCKQITIIEPLIQQLKAHLLPQLKAARLELLAAAGLFLRKMTLEELRTKREEVVRSLQPLMAPEVEDLCHFILFLKSFEHFIGEPSPEETREPHFLVPVELVDFLMLDGIEELVDVVLAEKVKAQPKPAEAAPAKAASAPGSKAAGGAAEGTAAAPQPPVLIKVRPGDKFQAVLNRLKAMGYEVERQQSSHLILKFYSDGEENTVVLPKHPHLKPGTAHSVQKQANAPFTV